MVMGIVSRWMALVRSRRQSSRRPRRRDDCLEHLPPSARPGLWRPRGPQVSGAPRSPVRPVQAASHALAIEPGGAGVEQDASGSRPKFPVKSLRGHGTSPRAPVLGPPLQRSQRLLPVSGGPHGPKLGLCARTPWLLAPALTHVSEHGEDHRDATGLLPPRGQVTSYNSCKSGGGTRGPSPVR